MNYHVIKRPRENGRPGPLMDYTISIYQAIKALEGSDQLVAVVGNGYQFKKSTRTRMNDLIRWIDPSVRLEFAQAQERDYYTVSLKPVSSFNSATNAH